MERAEAEAVYEQGRDAVVWVLLALSARIDAQDAQVAKQAGQIEKLLARVEDLEQRLGRNSRNFLDTTKPGPAGRACAQSRAGVGAQAGWAAGS